MFRSLLTGLALGALLAPLLPASAQGAGDSDPESECAGCLGGGGGSAEISGPGASDEVFLRIDMDKPADGICAGPFPVDGVPVCIVIPCSYQAVTSWNLPPGVVGTQTITGEPVLHLTGTMSHHPSGLIECGEMVAIELAVGGSSIKVDGTCSECDIY
ncbi:MAG: hypothetical protein AAF682_11550 [Planctomycetota bacterium]